MQAENLGRKFAILGIGQPRVARDFFANIQNKERKQNGLKA
jgi:hypothetical protein